MYNLFSCISCCQVKPPKGTLSSSYADALQLLRPPATLRPSTQHSDQGNGSKYWHVLEGWTWVGSILEFLRLIVTLAYHHFP